MPAAPKGVPNFFISVTYFKHAASQIGSVFVLVTVRARIEQVRLPDLTYQPPAVPQGGHPTPLPPGIAILTLPKPIPAIPDNTLQRIVGIVAKMSGLISVPFLFFVKPIAATAMLAFLVFGVWWVVLESMRKKELQKLKQEYEEELRPWNLAVAPIRGEAEKRRRTSIDAEQRLQVVEANWVARASWYRNQFEMKKAELRVLRDRHESLAREYAADWLRLQSKAHEIQLSQFLQSQFISNANIPDIGPTRKAILVSFGIETAFDVEENAILEMLGFGPKLTKRLIRWRQDIERKFIFNAAIGIPSQQQVLDLKLAQSQQHIETRLLAGEGELQAIVKQAESELRLLYNHIRSCMQSLVQSQLDLKILPPDV